MPDARHVVAFLASWGAQFILMTSKIGTSYIQTKVDQKHGTSAHHVASVIKEAGLRVGVWNFLAWGIVAFDSMTDWAFSAGMGFWQQAFFCTVTFLCTFYFGTWGIMNSAAGIHGMRE
jgi:hypothetical protein